MLATPASTRAQASVALADLMAARVLPIPLFERSKGERSKGSSSNVNAPDLLPILCGKEESGPQHSVCRLPAAGRLSAPRGETLPFFPPQPIEHFIASARVRAGKKGAAPPSAPSRPPSAPSRSTIVCVSEERGDGEGSASQSLSLMSDTLRYISLANLDRDTVGLRKINGPVCRGAWRRGGGVLDDIFVYLDSKST